MNATFSEPASPGQGDSVRVFLERCPSARDETGDQGTIASVHRARVVLVRLEAGIFVTTKHARHGVADTEVVQ